MYTSARTKRRQRLLADVESLQQDISTLAPNQISLNVWVPPQLLVIRALQNLQSLALGSVLLSQRCQEEEGRT